MVKILYIRINKNCNAHCFMCDFWKNTEKSEITQEQFENILKKFEDVDMVRFTGGEPLLCEKLPNFISICHSKKIKTSIITNGLILKDKIDPLVEYGLNQVIVSVDGSTSELHDKLRGTPGLLNRIEESLEYIKNKNMKIHTRVNTVASWINISDLPNLVKWLDKYYVEQWSIIPIKLENFKWSDKITLEHFKEDYSNFQKSIQNCNVNLMGYSSNWAKNIERFWDGNERIGPKSKCAITSLVAFYDPFSSHIYPCNCIPHRKKQFCGGIDEKKWYYENGFKYCNGCEPLNAYCADFPEVIEKNIFNF